MSNFKAIRERLELTQEDMAEALSCSQGNVSLLDRGQTVLPDMAKKLITFAATRGVTLTYEDIYGPVRTPKKPKPGTGSERPQARARESKGRR